jgi:hypothetical protein
VKRLILATIFAFASIAHADKASISVNSFTGLLKSAEGISRIEVYFQNDGKIAVVGGQFLRVAAVEPIVVSDKRALDGPLVLQISNVVQLIVSSGETVDGAIHYQLKVGAQMISLTPLVNLEINKSVAAQKPANQFVCQKDWIDCMPPAMSPYCSQEYSDWAEKNCGGRPMIAE